MVQKFKVMNFQKRVNPNFHTKWRDRYLTIGKESLQIFCCPWFFLSVVFPPLPTDFWIFPIRFFGVLWKTLSKIWWSEKPKVFKIIVKNNFTSLDTLYYMIIIWRPIQKFMFFLKWILIVFTKIHIYYVMHSRFKTSGSQT